MVYRILAVLILVSLLISMSGCMTFGTYVEDEKLALLKENETTRVELLQLLGKPDSIIPGEGGKGEILIYRWQKANVQATDLIPILPMLYSEHKQKRRAVKLFVDDAGILRKATVDEKPFVYRFGLLNQ